MATTIDNNVRVLTGRRAICELLILRNSTLLCAWKSYGIRMGDNFISVLSEPPAPKDYISNTSRLQHGDRMITPVANGTPSYRYKSRELTLVFQFVADSPIELEYNKRRFLSDIEQAGGSLTIAAAGADYLLRSDIPAAAIAATDKSQFYVVKKSGENYQFAPMFQPYVTDSKGAETPNRSPLTSANAPRLHRLTYLGKGSEYSMSLDRRSCRFAMKFRESDPSDTGYPSAH
jgi:hypothetical protein